MAGILRKGMSWLGLGPDEEYDDYEPLDVYEDADAPVPVGASTGPALRTIPKPRPAAPEPEWEEPAETSASGGGIRVLPPPASDRPEVISTSESPRPRSVVRPLQSQAGAKPHVVSPKSFNDAQEVGDWFKRRQPVIVNLQGMERDLARRLLDFASGVAYGLGGTVERVASHVYLLTPADVEVSADDRRRFRDGGAVDES